MSEMATVLPGNARVHRAERRTLSATSISRHFALSNCERMLRLDSEFYSVRNEFLHRSGRAAGQYRPREDTIAAVMTRRGIVFETSLQSRLQENESFFVLDFAAQGHNTPETVAEALVGIDRPTVLCQLELLLIEQEGHAILQGLASTGVHLSVCKPDFVFVDQVSGELATAADEASPPCDCLIVDAKSSSKVKVTHFAQISIYMIALDAFIKEHKVNEKRGQLNRPPLRVSSVGGVWTPRSSQSFEHKRRVVDAGPDFFELSIVRQQMESFFTYHETNESTLIYSNQGQELHSIKILYPW